MWDLRHYSIPAARDLIQLDDSTMALVMSYIPGPTLAQVIEKSGRMDAEHVAWISQRILNALMYMHERGIVHGDLKPQNIIIEPAAAVASTTSCRSRRHRCGTSRSARWTTRSARNWSPVRRARNRGSS
jgi:serine/threonine protein kinase